MTDTGLLTRILEAPLMVYDGRPVDVSVTKTEPLVEKMSANYGLASAEVCDEEYYQIQGETK